MEVPGSMVEDIIVASASCFRSFFCAACMRRLRSELAAAAPLRSVWQHSGLVFDFDDNNKREICKKKKVGPIAHRRATNITAVLCPLHAT